MSEQRRIGRTIEDSIERWDRDEPAAQSSAPNVVVIVLDDVGFAQLGCYGGSIETPNIDRLAHDGLRYTNFHTTAVCSPTRASLLTGRNCHAVGFGHVTERLAGYPGYSMRLPDSAATIASILRMSGYSTRAVGKWHLLPSYETGPQGPFDRWPLAKGFERFYGFMGGSTDQYAPELFRDNSPTTPNDSDGQPYHLSVDLVDEAIRDLSDLRAMAPHRPFFLYLAPVAGHAPHQAPPEWIEHYRGRFDDGWDRERDRILTRQIELGVMPPGTRLGVSNPGVQDWDELHADERRLFARMMEVYAGFISHTDAQIGKLLDHLERTGQLDDTVVMLLSDNGASGEGGPDGSVDEGLFRNNRPQTAADGLAHIDELGGPRLYNHYPWGWAQAGNTPFRWYKQFTHAGGITNGLIVRWPAGGVPAGEIRRHYHHVIDVMPTLLDVIGIDPPEDLNGVTQQPIDGVSMRYTFTVAESSSRRHTQHYEMWGNRGLYHDGWMAVCRLHPDAPAAHQPTPMVAFDELTWELYDHTADPTECDDLAETHPRTLEHLEQLWWAAAGRYQVLPVDTRPRSQRWPTQRPVPTGADPDRWVFHGPGGPHERGVGPHIAGRSFRLQARVYVHGADPPTGMLFALGGLHGGIWWYLLDGEMCLESAPTSITSHTIATPVTLSSGDHVLTAHVVASQDLTADVRFEVDDQVVDQRRLEGLLGRVPIGSGRTYVGRAHAPSVDGAFTPPFELTAHLDELVVTTGAELVAVVDTEPASEMRDQ